MAKDTTIQSMGGKATVKKYGKKYMKKLAREGARKRWAKNKRK